ncbi:MAG: RNA polymerase sigma factor [Acidobacteria bacterium]|nr:RNA polymerase sigma factor [Acidobacteriota bacterium]
MKPEPDRGEKELVRRLKAGERDVLVHLMDRHGENLMRYLCAVTGTRETAEDAFQDTWVRVMEGIGRFDVERELAPWLFRIARNCAYDMARRRKGRWLSLGGDDREPDRTDCADRDPQFVDRVLNRDIAGRLLAGLQPEHREILWFRFFRDESYEELTRSLGLPMGTVKSRLKRALDRVALLYRDIGGHADER